MATFDKVLYTAKAHTTDGREGGTSHTDDGRLDVRLSTPGGPGTGTNPEQLLALGLVRMLPVRNKFSGKYVHRTITGGIGHNLPPEAPQAFAQAVIDADRFAA